jgi:hypothetical protein
MRLDFFLGGHITRAVAGIGSACGLGASPAPDPRVAGIYIEESGSWHRKRLRPGRKPDLGPPGVIFIVRPPWRFDGCVVGPLLRGRCVLHCATGCATDCTGHSGVQCVSRAWGQPGWYGCCRCHSPPLLAFIYTHADATSKNIYPICRSHHPLFPAVRHIAFVS